MGVMTMNSKEADKMFKILGIDDINQVKSFTLKMAANQIVTVNVEFFPSPKQIDELAGCFKKYTLIEID